MDRRSGVGAWEWLMALGSIMLIMNYVLRWVVCGIEVIVCAGETGEIEG